MKRVTLITVVLLAIILWMAPGAEAQQSSTFVVSTGTKSAKFRVDGLQYIGQGAFNWPNGSKHVLEFVIQEDGYQYSDVFQSRYLFSGWTDNQGILTTGATPVQIITADPQVSSYRAAVTVEHLVLLTLLDGRPLGGGGACGAPGDPSASDFRIGIVYVDGVCYWNNVRLWMAEGAHTLSVFPFPGYLFLGWKADQNGPEGFLRAMTITGPLTLVARFTPAKRVNFRTDPPGLQVRVDRTDVRTTDIEPCEPNNLLPVPAPKGILPMCTGEFDFAPGSSHILGAPSPQVDKIGKTWLFTGFSNGMQQNSIYVTSQAILPSETLVASFQRGISTSVTSKPSGLKLSIDGRDNWPENYFVFLPGSKHTVSAAAQQADARGRKYVFKRWSNGGTQSQEVTVPANPDASFVLVAEYDLLSQTVVRSLPPGGEVLVDGARCPTPCAIDRPDGTDVRIAAPPITNVSELSRLEFVSWSDAGARDRTINVSGGEATSLTANYRASNRITLGLDPPEGGRILVEPSSPDGFYVEGAMVTLRVEEKPGFRFRRWDYDVTGTSGTVVLTMSRPRAAVARFDKVPFIAPTGIRNAAGNTPDRVVAPGSLISILGDGLAPYAEVGPAGPILAQALAGTSVMVGNRILPLVSVSPERIDAQLPRDLAPGEYELRAIRLGQPDLTGKFTVVTAAPGIFNQAFDDQAYAVGAREDGSQLSPEKAVKRGELVTLNGTGFGPYDLTQPEGFALPPFPPYKTANEVEVWLGEIRLDTIWSGGAAGQVGIDQVRFRIPKDLPEAAGASPVKIMIAGRESNTVLLPIE